MNSFVTVDCRSGEISAICVIYDCSCSERAARLGEERGREEEREERERELSVASQCCGNTNYINSSLCGGIKTPRLERNTVTV